MANEVRKNAAASRYEILDADRVVGIAEYVVTDGVVIMPHTVIEPSRRGEGLGAVLVGAALDDVRAAGRTVLPRCWYVAEFIDENPDYADLLA
jgi:predicted GNAT family acetyltransferase